MGCELGNHRTALFTFIGGGCPTAEHFLRNQNGYK